jgi:NADPH:quinone reductase-like Zn-dependent oxidoreductase
MRAAGVRLINGTVEALRLPGPRELQPDEILIDVRAAGVGNWDEFVRTGGWDTGTRPPMALGVEAAGIIAAAGSSVAGLAVGDRVTAQAAIQVVPDGARLGELARLAAQHALVIPSIRSYPLAQAGEALALARHGAGGAGLVLRPAPATRS